ncbi:MAG: apolipoprotein N-acyltransferase [Deltaproteobacteria bacterium]|nr:apolipoprotein N-acyltransferase [Deltaproteobacteria bacterium]
MKWEPARVLTGIAAAGLVAWVAPSWLWGLPALALVWAPLPLSLTVGASTLSALSAPPDGTPLAHWVAFVPVLYALSLTGSRGTRWLAVLFGTLTTAFIFSWIGHTITTFSNIPAPVAGLGVVLFSLVFGLPYLPLLMAAHPLRRRAGDAWMVLWPAAGVVIEWATLYLVLFPYTLGATQYRAPFLVQLVAYTGVTGLTWLLFFVNAVLTEHLLRRREGRPLPLRWLAAAVSLISAVVLLGVWRHGQVEEALAAAPRLRVAQLQSDITMEQVMRREHRYAMAEWISETARIAPDTVDLVVWPEGAGPNYPQEWEAYGPAIRKLAQVGHFPILLGGGWWEIETDPDTQQRRPVAWNSIFLIGADGEQKGRYDKLYPLPFGEYIPLSRQLPWLRELVQGPGDFRAGTEAKVLVDGDLRLASPVCYEAILPYVCRAFEDPTLLVNVTNDAWFGVRPAPQQHAMLAAIRATELGRPLVRSAYTGVSMVVEPHGRILYETEPFARVNRIVEVRDAQLQTLYARWGDWFPTLNLIVLVLGFLLSPWRRPRP